MLATSTTPRELTTLFSRLAQVERLTTMQEWWMYGRVLPEAGALAEVASLLAAIRAELGNVLDAFGYPQPPTLTVMGTSELTFAQSFAGDSGWALAHREEAISALHMVARALPEFFTQVMRIRFHLGESAGADMPRRVLTRAIERLNDIRELVGGY